MPIAIKDLDSQRQTRKIFRARGARGAFFRSNGGEPLIFCFVPEHA